MIGKPRGRRPNRAVSSELWVYQCQYCGQWHLTHRDPALAQAVGHFKRSQKPYSRKKGFKPRRR